MAYPIEIKHVMQRDFARYIGMQVKLRRTALKMTLNDVCEITGITTAKLSQLERGELDIRISTLALLRSALALDITITGL